MRLWFVVWTSSIPLIAPFCSVLLLLHSLGCWEGLSLGGAWHDHTWPPITLQESSLRQWMAKKSWLIGFGRGQGCLMQIPPTRDIKGRAAILYTSLWLPGHRLPVRCPFSLFSPLLHLLKFNRPSEILKWEVVSDRYWCFRMSPTEDKSVHILSAALPWNIKAAGAEVLAAWPEATLGWAQPSLAGIKGGMDALPMASSPGLHPSEVLGYPSYVREPSAAWDAKGTFADGYSFFPLVQRLSGCKKKQA